MSTLSQPNLTPKWKEEVNRRVAAHKNRKNSSTEDTPVTQAAANASRAAQAAARVAARYAKAPSYSQLQAEEARVAVKAAEIATQVALEAQATAESVLAELHAASQERSRGPAVVEDIAQVQRRQQNVGSAESGQEEMRLQAEEVTSAAPVPLPAPEVRYQQPFAVRWDPDMPAREAERQAGPRGEERRGPAQRSQEQRAPDRRAQEQRRQDQRGREDFELSVEDWWSPAEVGSALRNEPLAVDSEDSMQANLIQFPRELVATRKIRPRLAENYAGSMTEAEGQLSIFEVDPRSISTEVEPVPSTQEGAAWSVPERSTPGWSGIHLDAHPATARTSTPVSDTRRIAHLAPFGLRMMATVIDCALILACFVVAGFIAAGSFSHPPTGKPAELLGAFAMVSIGLLYYGVFFFLGISTPGMKYAGIGLCTFDDKSPTQEQLQKRLGAMALSLFPVGLGVVWSVFDEDHLTWHDRISQTYLRKC